MKMKVDLDLRKGLGVVRDQGSRPTCLAFAASAAHENKRSMSGYLSTEYLFFHSVQRSHREPNRGLTVAALTAALAGEGQPLESECPYRHNPLTRWSPPMINGPIFKATIAFSQRTIAEVHQALSVGTAVVLIVTLTVAFFRPDLDAVVRLQAGDRTIGSRHALLAIGSGSSQDGQYILVRNSWGSKWGDKGHGWLSDAYLAAQLRETGVVQQTAV